MVDWKAAGYLADAHRVRDLLREDYCSPAKEKVRTRSIRFLKRCGPDLVLDAWGGGISAERMVVAGLRVLSVDDGRAFASKNVSKPRGWRALSICADESGYLSAPGSLAKHAYRADTAFLDFCGHWSRETERTLRACRHMKALVVTLMPDRADFGGSFSRESWLAIYTALLRQHTGMNLAWSQPYVRSSSGQRAIVFALELRPNIGTRICACGCGEPVLAPRHKYASNECAARFWSRRRWSNPAIKEKVQAASRKWVVANRAKVREDQRAYYAENRDKRREYARRYFAANPERYREYGKKANQKRAVKGQGRDDLALSLLKPTATDI